ncbi:MAG: hypothetical protein GY830_00990 [Bacteroidetes bacterium]|nr:hypothetical protein [Bacteroidota bacterium]
MNFTQYYSEETSKLIKKLNLEKISNEQKGLLKAIEDKDRNSKFIKNVEQIIRKKQIEGEISTIIPKIINDGLFAYVFYSKISLTHIHRTQILRNYINSKNIQLDIKTPTIHQTKYGLPYLGTLNGTEIYYYLSDYNKPTSHNEVIQRVKIVENSLEYSKSIIIFDDVIGGGKMEDSFPQVFKLTNVLNIKSFINE